MYHVYILRCADGTLYTGITTELERRLREHNSSKAGAKYTRCRRPSVCVYARRFRTRGAAAAEEYRIKQLGRAAKLELIRSREEAAEKSGKQRASMTSEIKKEP